MQFDEDQLINNTSTFFYDENGLMAGGTEAKTGGTPRKNSNKHDDEDGEKDKINNSDLYALPVTAMVEQQEIEKKYMARNKSNVDPGGLPQKRSRYQP